MINQKFVDFVNEEIKQGKNNDEISKELLEKNYSNRDIRNAFDIIAKGGVLTTGIKMILFIQIFIVLFNIISISSSYISCKGVGEFCGLPAALMFIPSVVLFIIISAIGQNSANKKIKIYESKNQKAPLFIRLLSLPSGLSKIILIALIVFVIMFLLYIKYYMGIPIVLF